MRSHRPSSTSSGSTTIFGNAETSICTRQCPATCWRSPAGRDIPVARGVDQPLAMPYRGAVAFVHGTDGQGDVFLPPPTTAAVRDRRRGVHRPNGVDSARRDHAGCARTTDQRRARPCSSIRRSARQLAGIVLMGGNAFVGGNASPAAEANILNDPEAADIVFGADCQIVMAGLDVTEQTVMTASDTAQIAIVRQPPSATSGSDRSVLRELLPRSASASTASTCTTRRRSATCWRRSSTQWVEYPDTSRLSATASVAARHNPPCTSATRRRPWSRTAARSHSHRRRCSRGRRARTGTPAGDTPCRSDPRRPEHAT